MRVRLFCYGKPLPMARQPPASQELELASCRKFLKTATGWQRISWNVLTLNRIERWHPINADKDA
jgi:hypothetical protein